MDLILFLPLFVGFLTAIIAALQQREQERFEDLVSILESLSEVSRARLRRLRRLSRFNLYANIQELREFEREIGSASPDGLHQPDFGQYGGPNNEDRASSCGIVLASVRRLPCR